MTTTYHTVLADAVGAAEPLIRQHIEEVAAFYPGPKNMLWELAMTYCRGGVYCVAIRDGELIGYIAATNPNQPSQGVHTYIKPEFRGGVVFRGLLKELSKSVKLDNQPVSMMKQHGKRKSLVTKLMKERSEHG